MQRFYFLIFVLFLVACKDKEQVKPLHIPQLMEIPQGFPGVYFPVDNAYTKARWDLGKKLFFDPVMSSDSTISCASCHEPSLAFSDDVAFSDGIQDRPGVRNASPLFNVAYHPYFTREGGVPTLEMQVLVPIQEHNEFDFNILLIAERLNKMPEYVSMSLEAYDRVPDAFTITRSLAIFERSLLSGNSPFDQYLYQEDLDAMSTEELNGMDLFFSARTNCAACHSSFNFTNYAFENNGLYEVYPDPGRFRLTGNELDRARFKVPSLRNIELTGPYMHDGSFETLEEIILHYNVGGEEHPHKSNLIRPLHLTEKEQSDLVAFLKSLTDQTFIENPIFRN
jgi:cytochrome c peroxidase